MDCESSVWSWDRFPARYIEAWKRRFRDVQFRNGSSEVSNHQKSRWFWQWFHITTIGSGLPRRDRAAIEWNAEEAKLRHLPIGADVEFDAEAYGWTRSINTPWARDNLFNHGIIVSRDLRCIATCAL